MFTKLYSRYDALHEPCRLLSVLAVMLGVLFAGDVINFLYSPFGYLIWAIFFSIMIFSRMRYLHR